MPDNVELCEIMYRHLMWLSEKHQIATATGEAAKLYQQPPPCSPLDQV
jgi:hypothetical protein